MLALDGDANDEVLMLALRRTIYRKRDKEYVDCQCELLDVP